MTLGEVMTLYRNGSRPVTVYDSNSGMYKIRGVHPQEMIDLADYKAIAHRQVETMQIVTEPEIGIMFCLM